MNIQEALEQYGLTEKEASIYLAALELGRARGQEIARKASLPRTTGYSILEQLVHKKLILPIKEKKVREYVAENPETLVQKSELAFRTLRSAQPQLAKLFKDADNRPKIRYYDGLAEVKEMHENLLRQKKRGLRDYQVIVSETDFLDQDRNWSEAFVRRRAAMGLHARLIMEDSEDARRMQQNAKQINAEIRFMDNFFEERCRAGIYILLHTVQFIEYGKRPVAVEMESKELVAMLRMVFEALWKMLPPGPSSPTP